MNSVKISPTVSVNINLLHVFLTLAETLSFKMTADRISKSQSAVSAQIKMLETQLGVSLLNRTTRTVSLTPYGDMLLRNSKQGMNALTWGFRRLIETATSDRGRVILACSSTVASTWLPSILKEFEREFPSIHISLLEMPLNEIAQVVVAGEADFGLGPVFPSAEALQFEPIMNDEFVVIAPPELLGPRKRSISIPELAKLPLILTKQTNVSRQLLDEAMKEHGLLLNAKYECTHSLTLISMVRAGLGAAVIPASIATEFASRRFQAVPINDQKFLRKISIVTNRERELLPAAACLAGFMRSSVR
jgi:DNA-binding transcriptional LysR family regulator